MKQHKIGWLNIPGYTPETWNPIIGCSEKSDGCKNCFAEKQAWIRSFNPKTPQYKEVVSDGKWNGKASMVESQLTKPLSWKNPRAVFVCDMGDLFHESVPFEWIDAVFEVIEEKEEHIFIILTKRPERMHEYFGYKLLDGRWSEEPPEHIWLGVTAENQKQANNRIPILLQIPAAKRFVSIEPMLEFIDLDEQDDDHIWSYTSGFYHCQGMNEPCDMPHLDWVIVGGETGHKARPMHPDWVRSICNQCKDANVPFFFKQWGEWTTTYPQDRSLANMSQTYHHSTTFYKIGKTTAGNLLDGKQHHNWPELETENQ